MVKYNQRKFNKIHVLMDACIIIISYLLAYYLRFFVLNTGFDFFKIGVNEKWYSLNVYTDKLILIVPVYLFLYYFFKLYTPIENRLTLTRVFQIILANILGIVLFLFALYLQKEYNISRQFLILFFVMNVILSVGSRMLSKCRLR
jgi:FlaA1/EpsC-like NDP-sugar epimerase